MPSAVLWCQPLREGIIRRKCYISRRRLVGAGPAWRSVTTARDRPETRSDAAGRNPADPNGRQSTRHPCRSAAPPPSSAAPSNQLSSPFTKLPPPSPVAPPPSSLHRTWPSGPVPEVAGSRPVACPPSKPTPSQVRERWAARLPYRSAQTVLVGRIVRADSAGTTGLTGSALFRPCSDRVAGGNGVRLRQRRPTTRRKDGLITGHWSARPLRIVTAELFQQSEIKFKLFEI